MAELKGYEAKISEIDAKIQNIRKELGIEVGLDVPVKKERRTRMSGLDIEAKILEALKNAPFGFSQIGLNHTTGVCCGYFVNWLKESAANVRTDGEWSG